MTLSVSQWRALAGERRFAMEEHAADDRVGALYRDR
jgi:hypothetical protein